MEPETEDYFCGSYNFENQVKKQYEEFTSPYSGLAQVYQAGRALSEPTKIRALPLAHYRSGPFFSTDLKITIQALGLAYREKTYLPLMDEHRFSGILVSRLSRMLRSRNCPAKDRLGSRLIRIVGGDAGNANLGMWSGWAHLSHCWQPCFPGAWSGAHDVITTQLTWSREISRGFSWRQLHKLPQGRAARAFDLTTYEQARPWAGSH